MVLPPHPAFGPGSEPARCRLLALGPVNRGRDPKVKHGVTFFFKKLSLLYSPLAGFDFLLTTSSVEGCFCVG